MMTRQSTRGQKRQRTSSKEPIPRKSSKNNDVSIANVEVPKDAECGICYEKIQEIGKMDSCSHTFCYNCIMKWSKVTNLCPMCKQPFKTITQATVTFLFYVLYTSHHSSSAITQLSFFIFPVACSFHTLSSATVFFLVRCKDENLAHSCS
jgi:hypothetical protein